MDKFVFLDRDGTIIYDRNYLKDPDGVTLLPGAVEGLKEMQRRGYKLVMITNQSGVNRGFFTEEDLAAVHQRLCELLAEHGITLEKIYHCPHRPDENCTCRKPLTGMLEQACQDFQVDKEKSVMIGDTKGDILLGKNFHIRSIQVTNNFPTAPELPADLVCATLKEAADSLE